MKKPNKNNIETGSWVYCKNIDGLPFNQICLVVGVGFENMYIPCGYRKVFLSELVLSNGDLKGLSYEPFPEDEDRGSRFRIIGFPEESNDK